MGESISAFKHTVKTKATDNHACLRLVLIELGFSDCSVRMDL